MNYREIFQNRFLMKALVRDFFTQRGYLEVETPILVLQPGAEVHLNYFATSWTSSKGRTTPRWLRSSPEINMKQLLGEKGLENIFQLGPCFRDGLGEDGPWHHPEFAMVEWYGSGKSMEDLMEETEKLLVFTWERMLKKPRKPFWGKGAMVRLSVQEAFQELAGLDLVDEDPDLGKKAQKARLGSVESSDDFETAFFKILLEIIEPSLKKLGAVFLYNYPPSMAALAKVVHSWAKRFELYIDGVELCNGFEELVSFEENYQRLLEIKEKRKKAGRAPHGEDGHFLHAFQHGQIPSCSGNALGLDRWLALVLDCPLKKVLPFPGILDS